MAFKLVVLACLLAVAFGKPSIVPHIGNRIPLFEGRVVGGHDAKPGQFPHQVSLQWGAPPGIKYQHFCGGSIIDEEWILTAGHCVHAVPGYGSFVIKAGKHNINKNEESEQTVEVEKSMVHQSYTGGVGPYDIALLKLKSPIKFTKNVHSISLPKDGEETTGTVTLSGWGSVSLTSRPKYPSILQTVDLPVLDLETCNATIIEHGDSKLHKTNICTGPLTGGEGACSGDSGGPLISGNKIVGIVSWGYIPCGSVGSPSVFVKVSSFIDWIAETVLENVGVDE